MVISCQLSKDPRTGGLLLPLLLLLYCSIVLSLSLPMESLTSRSHASKQRLTCMEAVDMLAAVIASPPSLDLHSCGVEVHLQPGE